MAPLPLIKIATLFLKQGSKYFANGVKNYVIKHDHTRNWLIIPLGQKVHRAETAMKMRSLGLGKSKEIGKLSPEEAVDRGANALGEAVILMILIAIIFIERMYSSSSDRKKEDKFKLLEIKLDESFSKLEVNLQELQLQIEAQDAKIRSLERSLCAKK